MALGTELDIKTPDQLNMVSHFLEENIEQGRGQRVAIYDKDRAVTYNEICSLTNKVGNVLRDL